MRVSSSLIVASLVVGAGAAGAQDAAPVTTAAVDPTAHRHDGLYLRIALGFGGYSEAIGLEEADRSTSVKGLASTSELAIGGVVWPGIIVGAGAWGSSVLRSERTVDGPMPPDEVIAGSGNFTLVGPFLDWYFDERRGLHLQAAFGAATVRGWDLQEAQDNPDAVSFGGGVMFGLGHEWWVSDQWSLGILGRITAIVASQEDDDDRMWLHGITSTPSILFSATYN